VLDSSGSIAVLDACVLAPVPIVDTLLRLAAAQNSYIPGWSPQILEELSSTLLRFGLTKRQVDRRIERMMDSFPDALVQDFDELIPLMENDAKDRHVLAAAGKCNAQWIVSDNRRHFPEALLNSAMAHAVKVSVVNLMTMDYGGSADPSQMGSYAISAVNGATAQMLDNGIRARLGIIPMIGNNNVKPEVFTLADAKQVADWAQANPVVVRMSMWSVSRDNGCTEGAPRGQCSGVAQQPYDFSKILGAFH
jgi:hypothetical protein